MTEPTVVLTLAAAALAGLAMLVVAGLKAWRDWLDLRHRQLGAASATPGVGARIEIADLKERIRKLEAIAAGVDP